MSDHASAGPTGSDATVDASGSAIASAPVTAGWLPRSSAGTGSPTQPPLFTQRDSRTPGPGTLFSRVGDTAISETKYVQGDSTHCTALPTVPIRSYPSNTHCFAQPEPEPAPVPLVVLLSLCLLSRAESSSSAQDTTRAIVKGTSTRVMKPEDLVRYLSLHP